MNPLHGARRTVAIGLTAALALVSVAPLAHADHGHGGRRYKGDFRGRDRVVTQRVIEVRHGSSCGVPSFVSFLGGIAVGAVLSHASEPAYCPPPAHACAQPVYSYWDPYCHARFSSLDRYAAHLRCCDHPPIVRVIDTDSGECVHVLAYHHDRWREAGDWDDDRGDYDRTGDDD